MHNCFNIDSTTQLKRVFVSVDQYARGGLAVRLRDVADGEQYATVSIHVHGVRLAADEFIFKTYSENEGLLKSMLNAGFVEETGRSVQLSFGEPQPICRLIKR